MIKDEDKYKILWEFSPNGGPPHPISNEQTEALIINALQKILMAS